MYRVETVRAGPAGVSCRGNEHPRGLAGVRAGPQDGTQDAVVLGAAGVCRGKPPRRPKLGPFTGIIDRILEDDRTSHHKQRHTAKRIFDRLRDEYGFTGGYTIVKDYICVSRGFGRARCSCRSSIPPGHAQVDFGEAMAVIGGVARKVHFLAFDLPHSVMPAS